MSERKRVVLTGATGEIGSALAPALIDANYELVIFSRDPDTASRKVPGAAEYLRWSTEPDDDWDRWIDGAYGVINCAGVNVFSRRYTRAFARIAAESRILGTRRLVDAMRRARHKPRVLINSSSIGYYGLRDYDDEMIEEEAKKGTDRWALEAASIDAEPFSAESLGVRVVSIRTSYLLDWRGGGLPRQVTQIDKGRGSATTPMDAWRPWIHIVDEVALYLFALQNERVRAGLNASAPHPVRSGDFAVALTTAVVGKPVSRPMPGALLRLLMGPAADIIRYGKRVVPRKALDLGFIFAYPTLEEALRDLVPKIRAAAKPRIPGAVP